MSPSGSFLLRWRSRDAATSTVETEAPPLALVTGCPRSGTTALLGWLGTQPDVVARDESRLLVAAHRFLDEVDRFTALHDVRVRIVPALRQLYLAQLTDGIAPGTRLVVEKEPLEPVALPDLRYERFVQHVRVLLPALRIVFMVRHPIATVSSMRNRRWGYSLTSGDVHDVTVSDAIAIWRANAALAQRLRDDSAVHVCVYDALVSSPVEASARIATHLGFDVAHPFVARAPRPLVLSDAEQAEVLACTETERAWFDL